MAVQFLTFSCFCQKYSKEKIYSWYDEQTGIENTSLSRGIEYVEADRMINDKHKFFDSNEFHDGTVTYHGQTHFNVPLKYNVYDDVLMVNLQQGQRNSYFLLFTEKVNFFQIKEHKFRYVQVENNSNIKGFYEVIHEEGEIRIFKKHLKTKRELRDRSLAYIEFSTADPDYIFQYQNKYFKLDNQRDLISKLPYLRNKIRRYYGNNRKQARNNPDVFMKNLAIEMNDGISNSSNEI